MATVAFAGTQTITVVYYIKLIVTLIGRGWLGKAVVSNASGSIDVLSGWVKINSAAGTCVYGLQYNRTMPLSTVQNITNR